MEGLQASELGMERDATDWMSSSFWWKVPASRGWDGGKMASCFGLEVLDGGPEASCCEIAAERDSRDWLCSSAYRSVILSLILSGSEECFSENSSCSSPMAKLPMVIGLKTRGPIF